ncbi:MAG: hypothetical protein IKN55_10000 [Oscillospiraceae bacterium]|nr:hypothetical protein [Oscillospiraceae bacterium]
MKSGHKTGALAALLCTALLLCAGCSEPADEPFSESIYEGETTEYVMMTLSNDEVSNVVDAVPELPQNTEEDPTEQPSEGVQPSGSVSAFGRGVYLGRATDWTERFFYFTDGGNGNCVAQETGAGSPFTVTMDGQEKAVFHIGDTTESAELFWTDETTVLLLWESGVSETLTKVSEDPAGFRFYSSEALSNKALEVYEQKNGTRPAMADVTLSADDNVSVRLYDEVDGHKAICDWYTVNRYTGIGITMLGDPVDLSDGSTPPAQTATAATQPTSTQPATETTETQPST